jgi:glycosyltransferase involved in cell wall biosynthesis
MRPPPLVFTPAPDALGVKGAPARRPDKYKYSVIIPHRDRFELLSKLVCSIPTRNDVEILVIDDASDAQTRLKIAQLESRRRHMRLVRAQAGGARGAGWARNVGMGLAIGHYLLFADSDDAFNPDAFAVFDEVTARDEYDFIVFKAASRNPHGGHSSRTDYTNFLVDVASRLEKSARAKTKEILSKLDPPWAKLVRRALVTGHGIRFDEIHYSNDVLFNLRVLIHARDIAVCPQTVYWVLDHPASLIHALSETMLEQRFDACLRFNQEFRRHDFSGNVFNVTGGYVWQARHYGLGKMWALVRRSRAHRVRLLYPVDRYLWALLMKLKGVHPLKVRFQVVFGYRAFRPYL